MSVKTEHERIAFDALHGPWSTLYLLGLDIGPPAIDPARGFGRVAAELIDGDKTQVVSVSLARARSNH
jgi:hypothetical protein